MARAPGWRRLWRHSFRLGLRWLARDMWHGWPAGKVGFARLLVPLDPWRYYELGRAADESFEGLCLDVSSPKLLPTLLSAEGSGSWLCIDLFEEEIQAWRRIDPQLELEVADATNLPYPDASFDCCACISVLEHIGRGKDARALSEILRVVRPGGLLILTTDVAAVPQDVHVGDRIYGDASEETPDGVFFKREYAPAEVDDLVSGAGWEIEHREYAIQSRPGIERAFYRLAPVSYLVGPLLPVVCARNFKTSQSAELIERGGSGVVYLRLRKPTVAG
jgi:SAM-dependent methyltransferase